MTAIARHALPGRLLVAVLAQARHLITLAKPPVMHFSETDDRFLVATNGKASADGAE